jgi:hypothetical protein
MLEIRQAQINHLATHDRGRLLDGLVEYLQTDAPDLVENLDRGWLREAVDACVERADKFGIVNIEGIYSFVTASFLLGPSFFKEPRIKRLMPQAAGPEGATILDILANADDDVSQAALDLYDWQAWLPDGAE